MDKRSAQFSFCRKYRYVLWRIWENDKSRVAFIGLNPSTANEVVDDPTVRRCVGYAKDWGFGGMYMLNLFAYRMTDPKEFKKVPEPVGSKNNEFLKMYCDSMRLNVACWGNHGAFMGRGKIVIELLGIENLSCLGITKDGYPKHPLYLKRNAKLISLKE